MTKSIRERELLARTAISNSYLETLINAMEKNYRPHGPFQIMLPQALLLTGVALTRHQDEEAIDFEEAERIPKHPSHFSKTFIQTGMGNVPNIYALVVAPSASGKGNLDLSLAQAVGYENINNATYEGLMDMASDNPQILIADNEFSTLLKSPAASKLKTLITSLFNQGSMAMAMSQHTQAPQRQVPWIYPAVYGAVQPGLLPKIANLDDVTQGLLPRFLVGYLGNDEVNFTANPVNPDYETDHEMLVREMRAIAAKSAVVPVPNPNYANLLFDRVVDIDDSKLGAFKARYANEYLPRIALMLAIPPHPSEVEFELTITQENLEKAADILAYILSMAQMALGSVNDLSGAARTRENDIIRMVQLLAGMEDKGIEVGKSRNIIRMEDIARQSSGTGWDSGRRKKILTEMIERELVEARSGVSKLTGLARGCSLRLLRHNLPAGWLAN